MVSYLWTASCRSMLQTRSGFPVGDANCKGGHIITTSSRRRVSEELLTKVFRILEIFKLRNMVCSPQTIVDNKA